MTNETSELERDSAGGRGLRLLLIVGVIVLLLWLRSRGSSEEDDLPFSPDLVAQGVDLGGYSLCGSGCHDQPADDDASVSCSANEPDCTGRGECSCHLFSIESGEDRSDPDNWRHEAGPGEERVARAGREYHCFCVAE